MSAILHNQDGIQGLAGLADQSVDLIFTDPPYGIKGQNLHQHYNRDESQVVPGYTEIDQDQYAEFSQRWIQQAARVLKPTGSMYIVSGWSNLHHVLNALHATDLREINHLVAEYTFGVYTKNKWVSSHYHVLYWGKKKAYFNGTARFTDTQSSYNDRLSVQTLQREYQPGKVKNKNQLPVNFVKKFIEYSSQPGDLVVDPFAGSFSTGRAADQLGRNAVGFEINPAAAQAFGAI
jgi:site-specific DNA-methyltransferase (adenine-specific)